MRGFTLVELMTTLVVMTILGSIAAPSLGQFLVSNRITARVNDFVGALNLARTEAVRRGTAMTMCKSADGTTCAAAGTDWAVGWIICDDPLAAAACTGRPILRVHASLESGTKALATTAGMTPGLTFLPNGRPPAAYAAGQIQFCPFEAKYAKLGRAIVINTMGRPQVSSITCP